MGELDGLGLKLKKNAVFRVSLPYLKFICDHKLFFFHFQIYISISKKVLKKKKQKNKKKNKKKTTYLVISRLKP